MRSFIKSHKKTNSLDESPTGRSVPSSNGNEEISAHHIPKDDTLSFIQSSPPQFGSNFQGFKHSPGFESFHKLNKKMFPGKLFKKNPSSGSPLQQPASRFEPKEYRSAPGTPQSKKHDISNYIGMGRNSHDNSRFLTVKGTVTHAWGDNGDDEGQQVIVLNDGNGSDQTKLQSPAQSSTSVLPFDLGPAVRISSMTKSQERYPKNTWSGNHTSGTPSGEERPLRKVDGPQPQPHVCQKLSSVKNKNRQARIHSNDDILSLGNDSSVTMDFLRSAFSPASLNGDSPDKQNFNNNNGEVTEASTRSCSPSNVNVTDVQESLMFQNDLGDSQMEGDTTVYLTPAEEEEEGEEEEEEEDEEDEEDEDEEDDDAMSKFSFELNPINGRTSSVKYYSKPQPAEVKYIDDLYEDENFDEDMHCLEDDDGEMAFPSNDLDISDDSDTECAPMKSQRRNSPIKESRSVKKLQELTPVQKVQESEPVKKHQEPKPIKKHQEPKPIKKYQDLFDLSDDEKEEDTFGNDDSVSGLEGLGLDEDRIGRSIPIIKPSIEKRPFNLRSSPVKQSKRNSKWQERSSVNRSESRRSITFNTGRAVQSPLNLQYNPIVNSPLSIQPSLAMSQSAIRVQSPTKSPAGSKSPELRSAQLGKQIPKTKVVKNFSDIFDVDSSLSDEFEDHDESIRGENAISSQELQPPDREFLNSLDDIQQKKNLRMPASPLGKPKTPIQIYLTPPENISSSYDTPFDSQIQPFISTPSLPPPARSQGLKYHDLSSNLDSEVPGMMSNLYFIDEAEEDKYMEEHKLDDEDYLDEINTVPEDFNFSDSEHEVPTKFLLKHSLKGSFRGTHSYSSQPTGTARENLPTRNKLEIKNKTVTFFNHNWDRSPTERFQRSPRTSEQYSADDYIASPSKTDLAFTPITPSNSANQLSPGFMTDKSLSPIQEGSSSVDNSPRTRH